MFWDICINKNWLKKCVCVWWLWTWLIIGIFSYIFPLPQINRYRYIKIKIVVCSSTWVLPCEKKSSIALYCSVGNVICTLIFASSKIRFWYLKKYIRYANICIISAFECFGEILFLTFSSYNCTLYQSIYLSKYRWFKPELLQYDH